MKCLGTTTTLIVAICVAIAAGCGKSDDDADKDVGQADSAAVSSDVAVQVETTAETAVADIVVSDDAAAPDDVAAMDLPEDLGQEVAQAEVVEDVVDPNLIALNNAFANCLDYSLLYPWPEEAGHLAAARLTPKEFPFVVKRIAYYLSNDETEDVLCSAGLAHEVEIYVTEADEPQAEPQIVEAFVVEATDVTPGEGGYWTIEVVPTVDITLTEGQKIFVAVRMTREEPEAMCMFMCTDFTHADRNWWSNGVEPPYDWATLDSFDVPGDIDLTVYGVVGR